MRRKLSLPSRLAISNILYIIPVLVLMIQMISLRNEDIQFSETERNGIKYLQPLAAILSEVAQHKILAQRALSDDDVSKRLLPKVEQQIESNLNALTALHAELAPVELFARRQKLNPAKLKNEWNTLESSLPNLTLKESMTGHDKLIRELREMIAFTGDNSNLILDPNLDSYYLIELSLNALPYTLDLLQEVTTNTPPLFADQVFTTDERVQLSTYFTQLNVTALTRILNSAATALREDPAFYGKSERLQTNLPKTIAELNSGLGSFTALLKQILMNQRLPPLSSFDAAADRAINSILNTWAVSTEEPTYFLQNRIESISRARLREILIGLAAVAFAAITAYFINIGLNALFQETSEHLKTLISNAPIAIATIDSSQRILIHNPSLEKILGYDPDELQAMTITDFIHPEDRPLVQKHMREMAEGTRNNFKSESRLIDKNGRIIWSHFAAAAIRDKRRTAHTFIVMINDITENKHLENERLRLLNEAREALMVRDDFITMAAHEFRTPLTPIMIQFRILKKLFDDGLLESYPKEKLKKLFLISDTQILQLHDLVENLLNFSRLTSGELKLQYQEQTLSDIVTKLIKYFEWSAKEAHCEIKFESNGPGLGHWDHSLIERMLGNLIENAIKYGAGKPITIKLADFPDQAEISIHDEGIGISEEDQKRIFARFERAVSLRQFGGFGLGLYIAKQIVTAHGGSIRVAGAREQGSTFVVTLPKRQILSNAVAS